MPNLNRVPASILDDAGFAREVEEVSRAADSAHVAYVPTARLLDVLNEEDSMELGELEARLATDPDQLRTGLERLESLSLVSMEDHGGGAQVALTPEGRLAARIQGESS